MYIITFYSFKGGVGRTMALVNTGVKLARRGRKVLLVDFDLEAPGLTSYDLLRPAKPHPGIVEFVTEFRNTRHSPLVTDFIYEAKPVGKRDGKIWVMPAGRGDIEYRRKLNALSWRKLYQDEEGFLLFEDARLQWDAELHPDYVLIDARTGHTDIEGICTRQLADAVVVVFYPNEQNLAGLKEVCRDIRAEDDEKRLNKQIKLQFVASNVPDLDDERGLLHRHLADFRRELQIPHIPIIIHRKETLRMLDQPVFVLERRHSRLAREYRSLVRSLQIENPEDRDGALLFLRELQKERSRLIHWDEYDRQWLEELERRGGVPYPISARLGEITQRFWDDPEVLLRAAEAFQRKGEPGTALDLFNRVLKLLPECPEALLQRGFCQRELSNADHAKKDFLEYLRVHGGPFPQKLPIKERRSRAERNKRALLGLLDISLASFLDGLSFPRVPVDASTGTSEYSSFRLFTVVPYLFRQHRWDDAIKFLEKDHDLRDFRMFLLAMAHWGKTEQPPKDLCAEALTLFPHEKQAFDPAELQNVALLYWCVGEPEQAAANLDSAIRSLEETHELIDGVSYWSFQETTPRMFRRDCDEMRRMIRGEPVRPAFLRPLS